MSDRTSSTSLTEVFVDNSRFNQALDTILAFDDEKETIETREAFFALLNEGVVTIDAKDEQTFTIHLDKLKPDAASIRATISKALALDLPEGENTIHIAKESGASFQSFLLALEIYRGYRDELIKENISHEVMRDQIVPWFLSHPLNVRDEVGIIADGADTIAKALDDAKNNLKNFNEEDDEEDDEDALSSIRNLFEEDDEEDDEDALSNLRNLFENEQMESAATKVRASVEVARRSLEIPEVSGSIQRVNRAATEALHAMEDFDALYSEREQASFAEEKNTVTRAVHAIEEKVENLKLDEFFRDYQLSRTTYGASLLDRAKYEGVLGSMLIRRIEAFLNDPNKKDDEQGKKSLAGLLEKLSSGSDYNNVRSQVRHRQLSTQQTELQKSLQDLRGLLEPERVDNHIHQLLIDNLYQLNPRSNCISPLMKSLQSIRVQKSINKIFEGKVEKPPFAAVANVDVSDEKLKECKLDKLPITRPANAISVAEWNNRAQSTPQNRQRLMQFKLNRVDANIDFRNKIMISDPELYLKTLVNAEGNHYIVDEADLKNIDKLERDERVKIITQDPKVDTFYDGTQMPPVTIAHYHHSETEEYSCKQQFDPNGSLHVELTSPVTNTNKKPEVAALEFARQLQRRVLFSAPEGYSDVDRLAYLATFPIEITDLPKDISFKMMKKNLIKVGFGDDCILQATPSRVVGANLGTPPADTSPSPSHSP